jgi:TonB family protein
VIPARLLAPLALAAMAAGCALPQALQTDREGMPLNQEIEPEGGYKTGRPRGLRAEEAATDPNVVGCVKVEYMVDPDGVPSQVSILRSHPPGYFDAQALKAMERMRFRPRKSTSFSTRTFLFAPTQDRAALDSAALLCESVELKPLPPPPEPGTLNENTRPFIGTPYSDPPPDRGTDQPRRPTGR